MLINGERRTTTRTSQFPDCLESKIIRNKVEKKINTRFTKRFQKSSFKVTKLRFRPSYHNIHERQRINQRDINIRKTKRAMTMKQLDKVQDNDFRKLNQLIYCMNVDKINQFTNTREENFRPDESGLNLGEKLNYSRSGAVLSKQGKLGSEGIKEVLIEKLKEVLDIRKIEIDSPSYELKSRIRNLIKRFSDIHHGCKPVCKHLLNFERHVRVYIKKKMRRETLKLPVVRFEKIEFPEAVRPNRYY